MTKLILLTLVVVLTQSCTKPVQHKTVVRKGGSWVVYPTVYVEADKPQSTEQLYQITEGETVKTGKFLYIDLRNDLRATPKIHRAIEAVHGVTDVFKVDRYRLIVWYGHLYRYDEVARGVRGVVENAYATR